MEIHLEREYSKLYKTFTNLCREIENNFNQLIVALEKMDLDFFTAMPKLDRSVDKQEMIIEEECLKILALYHPVARDLRAIITILKINSEIERIGDLTANIASRAKSLKKLGMEASAFLIPQIYEVTQQMLKGSIECFLNKDVKLAVEVCRLDDKVDELHSEMYRVMRSKFSELPDKYDAFINYISISRFFERIADHSTNIAEDLLYMIDGRIFRHSRIETYRPTS